MSKLLARAFDPAARDGESENAAGKAVLVCRRNGIGLPRLAEHLAQECKVLPAPVVEPEAEPAACDVTLWFGKHRGETLREVAETDLPYLRWIVREHGDDDLVDATETVIEWFTGGHA